MLLKTEKSSAYNFFHNRKEACVDCQVKLTSTGSVLSINQQHLVDELKKDTYASLEALNTAVKKIVADINQRPFQKKSDIRKSRMNGFEKYDKPRMNQLPGESYTLCDYKYFLKVPDNYHI